MIVIQLDRVYHLRLTMGAIVEYEQLTDYKLTEINYSNFDMMINIVYVMLRRENNRLTLSGALKLLTEAKNKTKVFIAAQKAIEEAFYSKKKAEKITVKQENFSFQDELEIALKNLYMTPSAFWNLTPSEYTEMLEGFIKDQIKKENAWRAQAWYTALFTRVKEMPALGDFLIDEKETAEAREQSPEEMLARIKLINAALGGTVTEV